MLNILDTVSVSPEKARSSWRRLFAFGLPLTMAASLAGFANVAGAATTAKAGGKCATVEAKSGTLTCTKKAGRLVWSRTATAGGSTSSLDGTWKASSKSEVDYRVKEVLQGQSTEGVGKTNAVTGTMTIAGSKVTAVDLIADLTQLKSNADKRDSKVQGEILETGKFPTATLKLSAPIDFGSAPADKAQITAKAMATLTVHGVTKSVSFDAIARRNGSAIEVNGAIAFKLADFAIKDPSFSGVVTIEPNGLIEFIVIFER